MAKAPSNFLKPVVAPAHAAAHPAAAHSFLGLDPASLTLAKVADLGGDLLVNLTVAALIVVATIFISRWASKLVEDGLGKLGFGRHDRTLRLFCAALIRWVVIVLGVVAVLQRLGVQTTSIIAMLGAASLAIGLALQGALSNVAAGVLILLLRPYRVGDYVDIGGQSGTVRRLDLFTTSLITRDFRKIVVPNAKALGDVIVNETTYGRRRMDIPFDVARESDLARVMDVLCRTAAADKRVLKDPPPSAVVSQIKDSSLLVTLYAWIEPEDMFQIPNDLRLAVIEAFRREGIEIPYPRQVGLTPEQIPAPDMVAGREHNAPVGRA